MATYSRSWRIETIKARIVAIEEEIDALELGQIGVSYSLPTGHSLDTRGQIDALRNTLEYYERRLRELQPGMSITRGL